MREEILLKQHRDATLIVYFNTMITKENYNVTTYPTALYYNSFGTLEKMFVSSDEFNTNTALTTSDGVEIWGIEDNNNFQKLQSIPQGGNLVVGRSFWEITEEYPLSNKESVTFQFNLEMDKMFSGGSETHVFFSKKELDDLSISIQLERTYDVLNTLSVYNKAEGKMPKRSAKTGVVFGKLEARQKIKDEFGNNIMIPLRDVPIGIFNPSKTFPTVSSVNENGDRIRMFFKNENEGYPPEKYYPNESTYVFDKNSNFLLDKEEYLNKISEDKKLIPDEFKYITFTNENGEFILFDIPVGSQTLIFEVNMLQQGLSKDEVALNFFPYRGDNISNIDEVPHYFFKQIPIDVVPAWGDEQTGYTEVNITANLDLRKWATFFFPPVCNRVRNVADKFFNANDGWQDLGDTHNIILDKSEYQIGNSTTSPKEDVFFKLGDPYLYNLTPSPLVVEIRDMTKKGYPTEAIQVVEVQDVLKREGGKINILEWQQEFSQIKNRVEFHKFGYNAIKVPANLYDPYNYRVGEDGVTIITDSHQKGVWLASYQFKMYHTSKDFAYRSTGYYVQDWTTNSSRDHFHLNYGIPANSSATGQTDDISSQFTGRTSGFPYEKPWTINYPTPYSIPKVPSNQINPIVLQHNGNDYNVIESPNYKDGHVVRMGTLTPQGSSINGGGFGLSKFNAIIESEIIGGFKPTSFLYSVANSPLYLYEYAPWKQYGNYSNGYEQTKEHFRYYQNPGDTTYTEQNFIPSHVKDGEEYQRVECGHAYYLHPYGMPRIGYKFGYDFSCEGDTRLSVEGKRNSDIGFQTAHETDFYYSTWNGNYSIAFDGGRVLALRMDHDPNLDRNIVKNQGAFSIYRIINAVSADATQVYDLIETVAQIKKDIIIKLQTIQMQNDATPWQNVKLHHGGSNNELHKLNSQDMNLMANAYISITNNGIVSVEVKFCGISKVISPNETKKFLYSDMSTCDTWNGKSILLQTNSEYTYDNQNNIVFTKGKYTIGFYGVKIKDGNNGSVVNDNSGDYHASGVFVADTTYYMASKYSKIKIRNKCGSTSFSPNKATVNGLIFFAAMNTKFEGIKFTTSKYSSSILTHCDNNDNSSCWCDNDYGFYYGLL